MPADDSGFCHLHHPEAVAQRARYGEQVMAAHLDRLAARETLQTILKAMEDRCVAHGWNFRLLSSDEDRWQHATVSVSRPTPTPFGSITATGMFEVALEEGVDVRLQQSGSNSGLGELHAAILKELEAFGLRRSNKAPVHNPPISLEYSFEPMPPMSQRFRDSAEPNLVFVSYSHADAKWLTSMRSHLKLLERHAGIEQWDDTKIKPGTQWREEIQSALERAKVAVLLVSADFLTSDFIVTNELPPLLKAAQEHGTLILMLIVRPCRFEKTELARFQAVNPPSKPLSALSSSRREEWYVKLSGLIEDALASSAPAPVDLNNRPPKRDRSGAREREAPHPKESQAKPGSAELARRHKLRLRFWEQLLDLAAAKGLPFHINRSPSKSNWIGGRAGIAGYRWNYVIWMDDAGAVELDIDTGDKRTNKRLFDKLRSSKAAIESAFGAPLEWQRMDDARRSGVRYIVRKGGLTAPEEDWPQIQAAMVQAMARLSKVLQPHLQGRAGATQTEIPAAREAKFGSYTIYELESGSIEVERDGQRVKPTKPALREIASKLNLGLQNRSGNPMNTRQLGNHIIAHIQQLGTNPPD